MHCLVVVKRSEHVGARNGARRESAVGIRSGGATESTILRLHDIGIVGEERGLSKGGIGALQSWTRSLHNQNKVN